MFDILVYLFETYVHAGACPESDQLARKLSAAGFEEEEISEALSWLDGLRAEISIPDIDLSAISSDEVTLVVPRPRPPRRRHIPPIPPMIKKPSKD